MAHRVLTLLFVPAGKKSAVFGSFYAILIHTYLKESALVPIRRFVFVKLKFFILLTFYPHFVCNGMNKYAGLLSALHTVAFS